MTALSVVFLVGIRVWFPVCEVTGDMVMSCHWAGEMLKAMSAAMLIAAVVHMLMPDGKMKSGADLMLCALYAVTFLIPGRIISLCKMAEMNCRSHTELWTGIIMVLLMLTAIADMLFWWSQAGKERHRRKQTEKSE